jgi:hypothetical protein
MIGGLRGSAHLLKASKVDGLPINTLTIMLLWVKSERYLIIIVTT